MKKKRHPQSSKAAGRKVQQEVRDLILATFQELEPDDVRSTSMGASGEDLLLSPAARKRLPFDVEVKYRAKIAAIKYLMQAETHGDHKPLAVFRQARDKQLYAMLKFDDLLELLK